MRCAAPLLAGLIAAGAPSAARAGDRTLSAAAPAPDPASGPAPDLAAAPAPGPAALPAAVRAPDFARQLGVDPPGRRGVYAQAGLGLFGTVGGSRGVSFAQPSLEMAVGLDLGEASALFLQLGIGASRASCFDGPLDGCPGADSFGATFAELGVQSGLPLSQRLRLSGKILGGLTVFSPSPLASAASGAVPGSLRGPHFGLGLGLDYDTHLDHFALGLELLGRHTRAGRPGGGGTFGLTSFAMTPQIKYVF